MRERSSNGQYSYQNSRDFACFLTARQQAMTVKRGCRGFHTDSQASGFRIFSSRAMQADVRVFWAAKTEHLDGLLRVRPQLFPRVGLSRDALGQALSTKAVKVIVLGD